VQEGRVARYGDDHHLRARSRERALLCGAGYGIVSKILTGHTPQRIIEMCALNLRSEQSTTVNGRLKPCIECGAGIEQDRSVENYGGLRSLIAVSIMARNSPVYISTTSCS
jgi:hypothetical protein